MRQRGEGRDDRGHCIQTIYATPFTAVCVETRRRQGAHVLSMPPDMWLFRFNSCAHERTRTASRTDTQLAQARRVQPTGEQGAPTQAVALTRNDMGTEQKAQRKQGETEARAEQSIYRSQAAQFRVQFGRLVEHSEAAVRRACSDTHASHHHDAAQQRAADEPLSRRQQSNLAANGP